MRYKFKEYNTKSYIYKKKMFFWIFIKGPPLLSIIANTNKGGLLVATTQPQKINQGRRDRG